jgi:hypothetical protein
MSMIPDKQYANFDGALRAAKKLARDSGLVLSVYEDESSRWHVGIVKPGDSEIIASYLCGIEIKDFQILRDRESSWWGFEREFLCVGSGLNKRYKFFIGAYVLREHEESNIYDHDMVGISGTSVGVFEFDSAHECERWLYNEGWSDGTIISDLERKCRNVFCSVETDDDLD